VSKKNGSSHPRNQSIAAALNVARSVGKADGGEIKAFHGTNADVDSFRPLTHFGSAKAAKQRLNDKYKGNGNIIPVTLSMKNPLRVSDIEASDEASLLNSIKAGKYPRLDLRTANSRGVVEALKAAGHDGLVYKNNMEDRGADSYVNLTPDQVKIARTAKADGGETTTTTTSPGGFSGASQAAMDPVGDHLHTGPIHSPVAGRTDHLPMHVPSGSYVIPADIISAMGEGNTMAGFKHVRRMFEFAAKGAAPMDGQVPIVAAGGEYVLSPDEVAHAGGGDMNAGHRVLDDFVKRYRAQTIKTLSNLPGPKRD
jgi:hypothetical protein